MQELLLAQTETYREYSRKGEIVKGEERAVVKSRYEEDIHPNNHTAVWGSWWAAGVWGYACCHSSVHNSYCTGEAGKAEGKAVSKSAVPTPAARGNAPAPDPDPDAPEADAADKKASSDDSSSSDSDSESSSSSSSSDDEEKAASRAADKAQFERREKVLFALPPTIAIAMKVPVQKLETKRAKRQRAKERARERKAAGLVPEKKAKRKGSSSSSEEEGEEAAVAAAMAAQAAAERKAEAEIALGDRARGYNRGLEGSGVKAPTEAEMEAHRRRRLHADDPMASYVQEKRRKEAY